MFFEPREWTKGQKVKLSSAVSTEGIDGYAKEVLQKAVNTYGDKGSGVNKVVAFKDISLCEEGYSINITSDSVTVCYNAPRGLIYAMQTLLQMAENDEVFCGTLYDEPDCYFRGYRCYLPGNSKESLQNFYDMVDALSYYKYNRISFEIGGAMEYKLHPEINACWLEFAKDVRRYSGRVNEIHASVDWARNSIHADNGDGCVLTQDEVRMLIEYCKSRGITAYPEVPLLSHSDYLCMPHPEIAERQGQPYPDCYCPQNPKSYELVFDVLSEVIEVFDPDIINIGHDEWYSICVCDKCKSEKPERVFANDVIKIHDFLAKRGIKTMMWGDKLLNVVLPDGRTYGGAPADKFSGKKHIVFPHTFLAQTMLPKDIIMLNWYHSFGLQYDFTFHTNGYEMLFGNMTAERVEHWRLRRKFGLKGGSCSNWGSNHPDYMQRNCQYLHIIFGAFAMWSESYDNDRQTEILKRVFDEAFLLRHRETINKKHITVEHTTDFKIPYKVFYDGIFIEDEKYMLGNYKITYTDGTTANCKVVYGGNISHSGIACSFGDNIKNFNSKNIDESALGEICAGAIPFVKNGKTYYRTVFENPYPDKTICAFEYVPTQKDVNVEVITVNFND